MRNVWFAWFNFICLLFVIYEHMYVAQHTYVVYKLGLLAVPLFAIIAGYSWGSFLKRTRGEGGIYALKMFALPYLFWTFAYYVMNNIVLDVIIRGEVFKFPSWQELLRIVFLASSSTHLYFLSTLIELFLVVILIRRVVKSDLLFYIFVSLIGITDIVFADQMWAFWVVPNVCCGILLAIPKAEVYKLHKWKVASWLLLVMGLLLYFVANSRVSSYAAASAMVMISMSYPKVYAPKWLVSTAPYIMGIYLVHALFDAAASEVWKHFFSGPIPIPVGWMLSVLIFFVSMAAVYIQRKIPILREFV